jgi:hypothetical protein
MVVAAAQIVVQRSQPGLTYATIGRATQQVRSRARIAARIGLLEFARLMGTSDEQDTTYGQLLPDSLDRTRIALETFGYRVGTDAAAKRRGELRRNARTR